MTQPSPHLGQVGDLGGGARGVDCIIGLSQKRVADWRQGCVACLPDCTQQILGLHVPPPTPPPTQQGCLPLLLPCCCPHPYRSARLEGRPLQLEDSGLRGLEVYAGQEGIQGGGPQPHVVLRHGRAAVAHDCLGRDVEAAHEESEGHCHPAQHSEGEEEGGPAAGDGHGREEEEEEVEDGDSHQRPLAEPRQCHRAGGVSGGGPWGVAGGEAETPHMPSRRAETLPVLLPTLGKKEGANA